MRFFIVDDDKVVRSMIKEIIEDSDLGIVVGEADNGSLIDAFLLNMKKVDILIIDLLMPVRDGIQTLRALGSDFEGKVIMISQIESKEMIGEAYLIGVQYYITKPVNRLEILGVIENVTGHLRLEKSISDIQKTLNIFGSSNLKEKTPVTESKSKLIDATQFLLSELGIIGESGSKDLIGMVMHLHALEKVQPFENEFPALKDIFNDVAMKKLGQFELTEDVKKEVKAAEQRVRRAICQALNHLASIGLTDYANLKFEEYASNFFNFSEVRKKMMELQDKRNIPIGNTGIYIKKFIRVLYLEAKKRI